MRARTAIAVSKLGSDAFKDPRIIWIISEAYFGVFLDFPGTKNIC